MKDFELTNDQKEWFGDRMNENASGKVLIPSYLYKKFRSVTGDEFISNGRIKNWLIDNVYNWNGY